MLPVNASSASTSDDVDAVDSDRQAGSGREAQTISLIVLQLL